jgi:hypothetical protein
MKLKGFQKVFSMQSAMDQLKRMADYDLKQFRGNSQETVAVTEQTKRK